MVTMKLVQHFMREISWHVFIHNSSLFVQDVCGCVTVNPERLCKGMSGGCYARLELRPPSEDLPQQPVVAAAVYRVWYYCHEELASLHDPAFVLELRAVAGSQAMKSILVTKYSQSETIFVESFVSTAPRWRIWMKALLQVAHNGC